MAKSINFALGANSQAISWILCLFFIFFALLSDIHRKVIAYHPKCKVILNRKVCNIYDYYHPAQKKKIYLYYNMRKN